MSHSTAEELLTQMTRPSLYEVPPINYAQVRQEVEWEARRKGDPILTRESRLGASHLIEFIREKKTSDKAD